METRKDANDIIMPAPRLLAIIFTIAGLCFASMAADGVGKAQAQEVGEEASVDLAVFIQEETLTEPILVVANYGNEVAYGVRVEIEANTEIGDAPGYIRLPDPSGGSVEFSVDGDQNKAVWHIPQLAGLSQHTLSVNYGGITENEYLRFAFAAVSNDFPAEEFNLGNNAGEYFRVGLSISSELVVPGQYSVRAAPASTGGIVSYSTLQLH